MSEKGAGHIVPDVQDALISDMSNKPSRKAVWILIGALVGALIAALSMGMWWLSAAHHYSEYGTFFKGTLADRQVVGKSFVEHDGIGIMELIQWKIQVVDRYGQSVTLYQKSAVFQEKVPHQPKVEISGNQIRIDDGEEQLVVSVQRTANVDP